MGETKENGNGSLSAEKRQKSSKSRSIKGGRSRSGSQRRPTERVGCFQKISAVLTRVLFILHTSVALWRVWLVYPPHYMYFLCVGIGFLLIEMVFTLAVRQGREYKWFCPSVFFYLLSVVPCLWLLEFAELNQFSKTSVVAGGCNITMQSLSSDFIFTTAASLDNNTAFLRRNSRHVSIDVNLLGVKDHRLDESIDQLLKRMKRKINSFESTKRRKRRRNKKKWSRKSGKDVIAASSIIANLTETEASGIFSSASQPSPFATNTHAQTVDISDPYRFPLSSAHPDSAVLISQRSALSSFPETSPLPVASHANIPLITMETTSISTSHARDTTFPMMSTTAILWKSAQESVTTFKASSVEKIILVGVNLDDTTSSAVTEQSSMGQSLTTTRKTKLENLGKKITEFGENTLELLQNTTKRVEQILQGLDPENWLLSLHQVLLFVLVIGRWLLPKGEITRDQLSQLLLVFIGVGADILEFVTETIDHDVEKVRCNMTLHYIIYAVWSGSLIQFTLVLTAAKSQKTRLGFSDDQVTIISKRKSCCTGTVFNKADLWGILVTMMLQDMPFLAFRLYVIIVYEQVHQMMVFFTGKNVLVVCLQFYRLIVLQVQHKTTDEVTDSELQPLKETLGTLATRSRSSSVDDAIKNASLKTKHDGSLVVKIRLESETSMKRKRKSQNL
ncbi:uncharacterized protein LOC143459181 [Clavelina lepadiformis]|uniref:uncharacterized protein LOC143459181 n=1 Tax=Clavelina lepadiformis TaxID=159417 RepID=UPI0040424B1F